MTLPLDHLVLPVADLDVALARLSALGFTVAPNGIHPFGTANCCVYVKGGTFLEPLAIGDRSVADAAARDGNVFVARDRAFRDRQGDEGFSALVFGTANAGAEDSRFRAGDISAGKMLEFSRPFVDAQGKADTASFRLAFAAEATSPDAFFFACERVNAPKVDRSALERHANGVSSLTGVLAVAGAPLEHRDFLLRLTGAEATGDAASGFAIEAGNGTVLVVDAATAESRYGIAASAGNGLQLAGVIFGVADLVAAEKLFKANAISYERRDRKILVPPAAGQGATFVFEATT
ncbi:VOC family protein [Mesorhizobium sp. ZC-5]|uniref:VOC family protein n=1 Tax=Mesorhizobium sp. ZC-5 TaxID=2986066 RepID=UPI0021E7DAC0|nr:VOC family protein [Mesorhizobium sp. ZC-5]MCV3241506.1 VOC family protein [Mesorhizobium sp. ZC-5]